MEIHKELPIELTLDPDFWHYGANERSKRMWRILAYVALGLAAFFLILGILDGIF